VTPIADLLDALPLRAASFIVTVYGDVVEPRGGLLWMGTLVEVCGLVGISETRVRTAVSRLVAAGRLEGTRAGRRSYYRLTEPARGEFAAAADRIFRAAPPAQGWLIAVLPDGSAPPPGFGPLAPGVALGADHGRADDSEIVFAARALRGGAALRRLAARLWDLDGLAAEQAAFLARFTPLLADAERLSDEAGLVTRLLLVHAYRAIALREPCLPTDALPADWPGADARALFARLYARLSPAADSHVGRTFVDLDGHLPAITPATRRRLALLDAAAA
jgi:phenylacetic acid degradation operon negative regulatory protein